MKKFLQQNYKLIIVSIMIIATWTVFYRSDFLNSINSLPTSFGLSSTTFEDNRNFFEHNDALHLQVIIIKEVLILISGSLLLWSGCKSKN